MISKSIFKKNLDGLTYKEKTEIRMNDLNQQIEQKDQQIEQKDEENKKLKKEIEQLKQQISNQGWKTNFIPIFQNYLYQKDTYPFSIQD